MRAFQASPATETIQGLAMLTLALAALLTAVIGLRGVLAPSIAVDSVSALPGLSQATSAYNGSLTVSLEGAVSSPLGELAFTQNLTERSIDVSGTSFGPDVALRIARPLDSSAFIDSIELDGARPYRVDGALETGAAAIRKLSAKDQDLLHVPGEFITVYFHPDASSKLLSVVARIPPKVIPTKEFVFPVEGMGSAVTEDSSFFTYRWNSRSDIGHGDWSEDPGTPFFKEMTRPTTGHPSNFTYGWVSNDADNLYVALEFTPDNTLDGTEDYGKVYVKTPTGVKAFKVSVDDTRWGSTDFVYTPRAAYQHKAYRMKIALSDLGMKAVDDGEALPVAFAAYGTAAFAPDVSISKTLVTAGPYVAGQTITYSLFVANAGPGTATSVQVSDTPTNLAITSVSGGGCAALPCTIPSIAASADVTITVMATISAAGAFDNAATALAFEVDPSPANNTDNTGNGGAAAAAAPQIPTLGFGMLALLGIMLGVLGVRRLSGGA